MQHKHLPAEVMAHAAALYHVDPALLSALMQVESGGSGFLPSGRLKIVFERHIFWRRLRARGIDPSRIARSLPALCGPHWQPDEYPYGASDAQYDKLALIEAWVSKHAPAQKASYMKAAWESCSYGLFQILGCHYAEAGYPEVTSFIDAMEQSEECQLGIILHWMAATGRLDLLREKRWRAFVTCYNGNGQVGWYSDRLIAQYRNAAGFWLVYQRARLHNLRLRAKQSMGRMKHSLHIGKKVAVR